MYFGPDPTHGTFHHRDSLAVGTVVLGPAVITQEDSTTVVPPNWQIQVDPHQNLIMTRRPR
jgi:N-methylhydantoinase A